MMGFLAAGAGVVAGVDVVMPEKSAKSPLLGLADDADALLMNPNAEFDAVAGAAAGVVASAGAAGGGLMNPNPEADDDAGVGWVAKGSASFEAGAIGEEETKSIPNCDAAGDGAEAGAEL